MLQSRIRLSLNDSRNGWKAKSFPSESHSSPESSRALTHCSALFLPAFNKVFCSDGMIRLTNFSLGDGWYNSVYRTCKNTQVQIPANRGLNRLDTLHLKEIKFHRMWYFQMARFNRTLISGNSGWIRTTCTTQQLYQFATYVDFFLDSTFVLPRDDSTGESSFYCCTSCD